MSDDFSPKHWILDDEHQPLLVEGGTLEERLIRWGRWYEDFSNRCVASHKTRFFELSSVFLGIDHNFFDRGPPILFETMLFKRERQWKIIFDKPRLIREEAFDAFEDGQTQWRWSTWDDTAANHMAILRRLERFEENAMRVARKHKITVPEETAEERLERDAAAVSERLSELTGESFQAAIVRPPKPNS